jgi:hypothetical protein
MIERKAANFLANLSFSTPEKKYIKQMEKGQFSLWLELVLGGWQLGRVELASNGTVLAHVAKLVDGRLPSARVHGVTLADSNTAKTPYNRSHNQG